MALLAVLLIAVGGVRYGTSGDTLVVSPSIEVGVAEGDENYEFGFISGISGIRDGRFIVSDHLLVRIQVFDSTGTYLRTVGRSGFGPGELQAPSSVASLTTGQMAVVDIGFDAYLWFDPNDAPVARRRRPRDERHLREPIRADARGAFLDSRRGYNRSYRDFTIVRVALDRESEMTVDSLSIPAIPETVIPLEDPTTGFRGGYLRVPFTPYTCWAPLGGGVAYSVDGSYLIQRSLFTGRSDTLVNRGSRAGTRIPLPVGARVRDERIRELREMGERLGLDPSAWIEKIVIPERFPPVLGLFQDPYGRLWVLTADQSGRPLFDVWTQGGRLSGSLKLDTEEWPDLETLAISGTHVLGRFEGEWGQHIVRGFPIPLSLRAQVEAQR